MKNFSDLDNKSKMMANATKWLFELELLNSPQAKSYLIANILGVSSSIKDVDILIDQINRKMLIYVDISFWGKYFKKNEIIERILDRLQTVLPSFEFRVIFDLEMFNKSVTQAKQMAGIL